MIMPDSANLELKKILESREFRFSQQQVNYLSILLDKLKNYFKVWLDKLGDLLREFVPQDFQSRDFSSWVEVIHKFFSVLLDLSIKLVPIFVAGCLIYWGLRKFFLTKKVEIEESSYTGQQNTDRFLVDELRRLLSQGKYREILETLRLQLRKGLIWEKKILASDTDREVVLVVKDTGPIGSLFVQIQNLFEAVAFAQRPIDPVAVEKVCQGYLNLSSTGHK